MTEFHPHLPGDLIVHMNAEALIRHVQTDATEPWIWLLLRRFCIRPADRQRLSTICTRRYKHHKFINSDLIIRREPRVKIIADAFPEWDPLGS